ncbi:AraC family transcriptional regulator [Lachnoclostridium sp. An169]|uniref:AraC family transcriptional regulator n=1 Tax=Lachnoclostridium sp. An169 TaxID=1965569 RepID=UPI000B3901F7|nr:AraC family transcriptional regulator [Lachnoclostridium sp. An169]OUP86076.1 AraC family transcriptional regulator [Lachnoclostridium sp. An169]
MHRQLLEELAVITEEEQRILDGKDEIDQQIYMEKNDRIVDSGKLLKKGKLIQVRPHTRFVHFPEHTHNYIEVIYMCQGTTTHILNGSRVVLEEGDLLFLNQNAVQEILPAGREDIAVNFIVLPEFFDTAFSMMGEEDNLLKEFLVGALCGRDGEISYLYFHVADILPIQNLVENMVWTIFYDTPNKRSCNQITMGLLFLQLLNYMDKMETGGRKFDTEITAAVFRYIDEHYREASLKELAAELKFDIYWLSREIKRQTGRTYKELLQEKRMQQAAYMLTNSRMSVSEIISSVGYDNTSYFYRKFRERYGVSPKEYRAAGRTG